MLRRTRIPLALILAAVFCTPVARAQCWDEQAKLVASDGATKDRFGWSSALSGDTAVIGAYSASAPKLGSGAAYVLERNAGGPGAWGEVRKLVASNASKGMFFGWDVGIDGDTLVVVAPDSPPAGKLGMAYVFERDLGGPGNWGEARILVPPGAVPLDYYARSVAISGDTVVVGAERNGAAASNSGAVHVFERNLGGAANWGHAKAIAVPTVNLYLGSTVSISGDTIAASAIGDQTFGFQSGAAFLFERDQGGPGAWGQSAKLTASDGFMGDLFGRSLSIDVDTLVVGACLADHDDDDDSGAAYVFERDLGGPGAWGEVRKLTASDGVPDDAFSEVYGNGVAVSGDTIVVGAAQNDDGGTSSGSAYTYERGLGGPAGWSQTRKLVQPNPVKFDAFGFSVDVDGDSVLVGAIGGVHLGQSQGWARLYEPSAPGAVPYCTAGASAIGCEAFLAGCGTPSATAASGFTLQAGNTEGFRDAILYFGANGRQARPWGSGSLQCVRPPLQRTGVLGGAGNGAPGWCDGAFELDLNAYWCPSCPKPQHNPGAGTTVQAQLWILDPLNLPAGSVTTNAVEFTLVP